MMKQLDEKVIKTDRKMHAVFEDLEMVYDNVQYVWRSCGKPWRYGVSVNVLGLRSINQESEACVKVGSGLSEWFEGKQGVRQGCPMLPWFLHLPRYGSQRSTSHGAVRLDTWCRCCCLHMPHFWY